MLEIKFYIFKAINPDLAHQASEAVSEGGWFPVYSDVESVRERPFLVFYPSSSYLRSTSYEDTGGLKPL